MYLFYIATLSMVTYEGKVIPTFEYIVLNWLQSPSLPLLPAFLSHLLLNFYTLSSNSFPLPIPSPLFPLSLSIPKQALFHQPSFRRMVLEYSPPSHPTPDDTTAQQPHNLCVTFVQELRSLFSLMIHSQRKYVDPKAVVKVCRSLHRCSRTQHNMPLVSRANPYLRVAIIVQLSRSLHDCAIIAMQR